MSKHILDNLKIMYEAAASLKSTDALRKWLEKESKTKIIIDDNEDQPTWRFGSNLEPVVIRTIDLTASYNKLTDSEFFKFWFHSFHGLIPHEKEEALVTLSLLRGKYKEIFKKYPKYEILPYIRERLMKLSLTDNEIKTKLANVKNMKEYEWVGGEAHEIIISNNPAKYNKWHFQIFKKFDKL